MTTTIISTDTIGAGAQHTFSADHDDLVILPGVTLGSTTGSVLSGTSFNNLTVNILGTVVTGGDLQFQGMESVISIASGGSFVSLEPSYGNGAIYLVDNNKLENHGILIANTSIAILTKGGNTVINTGNIEGASGVFIGLLGDSGDQLINSGSISSGFYDDDVRNIRFNNAVQVEGLDTRITNLASGTVLGVSSEGAGVRFHQQAGGSSLVNRGSIESMQDAGVTMATVLGGQAEIRIVNFGTISGEDGSIIGSVNGDYLRNGGELFGDVDLGDGADFFDARAGVVNGDILLGAGDDRFISNPHEAETVDGGEGSDLLDFRYGGAATVALDLTVDADGVALGDTYTGFEKIYGSRVGDDVLRGDAGTNALFGNGGADMLDGSAGSDYLRGGRDTDIVTGGNGNDNFVMLFLNETGDTITDFSSTGAGNNDRITVGTSFGGGLTTGQLAASQFRSRADNAAQDADDRFIFRTTDETLWFDADGNGAAAAVMVADLQNGATMTNMDIFVV